jgi:hypothetical protein
MAAHGRQDVGHIGRFEKRILVLLTQSLPSSIKSSFMTLLQASTGPPVPPRVADRF